MTVNREEFGAYLAARIADARMSRRRVARRAGLDEGTVRNYLKGQIPQDAQDNLISLADALGVDRAEMMAAAGVEASRTLLTRPSRLDEPSTDELLRMLRERIEDAARASRLPQTQFTDAQIRARGRLIVRLDVTADEVREQGDVTAADAICELVEAMKDQMTAAMEAEISEDQARRPQPGK